MTLEQRIDQLESLLRSRQLCATQRDKAQAELQRLLAEKAAFDRAFEVQFGEW